MASLVRLRDFRAASCSTRCFAKSRRVFRALGNQNGSFHHRKCGRPMEREEDPFRRPMTHETRYSHANVSRKLRHAGAHRRMPETGSAQRIVELYAVGFVAECLKEMGRPVVDAVGAQHPHQGVPAVLALIKRHRKGAGDGGGGRLDIVGVHDQGAGEFLGRARELRQDEHPGVVRRSWRRGSCRRAKG